MYKKFLRVFLISIFAFFVNIEVSSKTQRGVNLTGIFVLKKKFHNGHQDEYLFLTSKMAYKVSRSLNNEVKDKLEEDLIIICKIVRGNRIIAIKSIKSPEELNP